MIISEKVAERLVRAITTTADIDAYIVDLPSIFLNVKAIDAVIRNRDRILETVPKTYRKQAEKVIDYLATNKDRIMRVLSTGSEGLAEAATQYLLSRISPETFSADYDHMFRVLSRIVPVRAAVRRGDGTAYAYVLDPTEEELKNVVEYDEWMIRNLMESIVAKFASVDIEKGEVTVYGRNRIAVTKRGALKAAEVLRRYDILTEYAENTVKNSLAASGLSDLVKSLKVGSTGIEMTLDAKAVLQHAREDVPKEVAENSEIAVHLHYDPVEDRVDGRIVYRSSVLIYTESVSGSLSNVGEAINSGLRRISRELPPVAKYVLHVKSLAEEMGYSFEVEDTRYYYDTSVRVVLRKTVDRASATITLHKSRNRSGIYVSVSLDRGRRKLEYSRVAAELIARNIAYDTVEEYGRSITVTKNFGFDSIEDALVYANKVVDVLNEVYRTYVENLESKRKTKKLTDRHYVAMFLAEHAGYLDLNVEALTGRPKTLMYSRVASVLRKIAPEKIDEYIKFAERWGEKSYVKANAYDIVRTLIEKNYVTLSPAGDVLVDGEPLTKLLKDVDMPSLYIAKVEAGVIRRYLSEARSVLDFLRERGLITPEVIKKLILYRIDLPPTVFLEKCGGKPLWDLLPEDVKQLYILNASWSSIETILDNEALRVLFYKYADSIVRRAFAIDERLGTKALIVYRPEAIGVNPDTVKIYRDANNNFVGIDVGEFVLVVHSVSDFAPSSTKTYLVFHKQKKVGVLMEGKTVVDVAFKAHKIYDKVLKELDYVKKVLEKRPGRVVEMGYYSTDFKLVEVVLPKKAGVRSPYARESMYGIHILLSPGISEVVARYVEESAQEELEEV